MTISSSRILSCSLSYLPLMRSVVTLDCRVCLSSILVHILPDFQIFDHNLVHHKRINYANHDLFLVFPELEVVSFVRF